jgi:hypothetical protein
LDGWTLVAFSRALPHEYQPMILTDYIQFSWKKNKWKIPFPCSLRNLTDNWKLGKLPHFILVGKETKTRTRNMEGERKHTLSWFHHNHMF